MAMTYRAARLKSPQTRQPHTKFVRTPRYCSEKRADVPAVLPV